MVQSRFERDVSAAGSYWVRRGDGSPAAAAALRHDAELLRTLDDESSLAFSALRSEPTGAALYLGDPGAVPLSVWRAEERSLAELLLASSAITRALAAVHAQRAIHGHPRPEAIFVAPDGSRVWLAGFDLGTRLEWSRPDSVAPDALGGQLAYLSPEQTGRMNRGVGHRSDLYALGVTLFELFTGQRPLSARDAIGWVHAHIARRPPLASAVDPRVPPAIAYLLARLLEKDPEDRYQSARGLLADLEEAEAALAEHGRIEPFDLGLSDGSDRFSIPDRLYGRDAERDRLVGALQGRGAGPRVVLVSGWSGIGKSALVGEVHRPLTGRQGYFSQGKAEPHARAIPYFALLQALADLCGQVLTEPEERLLQWSGRLQAAVEPNGALLVEVLPELAAIIGPQPAVAELPPLQARARFDLVVTRFIQAAAQPDRPLVVFLDDLQWIDPATLALLGGLLTEPATRDFLLLGAYRSNEVDDTHPLVPARASWEAAGLPVEHIELGPLSADAVTELIEATVGVGGDLKGLVSIVLEKTGANPFFTRSFLQSLHADDLIAWDGDRGGWTWDLRAIARRDLTDNVVEHMAARIRRLDEPVQRVLRVAAALGARFGIAAVAKALGEEEGDVARKLWTAAEQGHLDPLGDALGVDEVLDASLTSRAAASFRFVHDRIQEAAYSLLSDDERPALHLRLARMLVAETPPERLDDALFDVVSQWQRASGITPEEEIAVAGLEHRAASRASASGAQESAAAHLESALGRLPADGWSAERDLTSAVHLALARSRYTLGDVEGAEQICTVVLERADAAHEQLAVHAIRAEARTAAAQMAEAVAGVVEAARLMGRELTPLTDPADIQAAFGAVMGAFAGRSVADLAASPWVEDPAERTWQRVLCRSLPAAAMSSSPYYLSIMFAALTHLAEHGATDELGSVLGNLAVFYQLGGMTELAAEAGIGTVLARDRLGRGHGGLIEYNVFVAHWSRPAREALAAMRAGIATSLNEGDINTWGYCLNQSIKDAFLVGEPLAELDATYEAAWRGLTHRQQIPARGSVEVWGQAIACLRGQAPDPSRLQGDRCDTAAMLPIMVQLQVGPLVQYMVNADVMLAYWFGDWARCVERGHYLTELAEGLTQSLQLCHPHRLAYRAMARLELMRQGDDVEEGLASVQTDRAELARIAAFVPENHLHRLTLLDAELAAFEGRELDAINGFDAAIEQAGVHPFPQDVALAYERAAMFHLGAGRRGVGRVYLEEALAGWSRWGATAKADQLRRQHGAALPDRPGASLDLDTVLKATATISSEIVLDRLLEQLLALALENAGATGGALLLDRGDGLRVFAVGEADARPELLPGVPLAERPDVPAAIVQAAARTRRPVILDDLRKDSRFSSSGAVNTRSVLAVPLLRQGELVGAIYAHNDLTAGAFTRDRVELLGALSAQVAIALENADLYADLDAQARSFRRFVPQQFLSFLGRESVQDIVLGDAVQREMTVLFSDIRAFTSMSERLTPGESFQFLNNYLQRMGPVIRANGGFVDKFIGDAVMALFPESPADALASAVSMHTEVERFNTELPPDREIRIGVGLHVGALVLGVLGEAERMDGTVISDAVNVGARLESLCKKYGVGILASEQVLASVAPDRFPHRCLGDEVVRGKKEKVRIYEVFAGQAPDLVQAKLDTRPAFEAAVEAVRGGQAADAIVALRDVRARLPDDPVTAHLMREAAQLLTGAHSI